MQTRLKIALAAAGFALAAIPAFAAEMPTDGSKNFSTPTAAPSYFTNEAVPESARVDRSADFSSEDVAAAPEDGPAVSAAAEPERHGRHASGHSSGKHSASRSKGHGASTHYAKATTKDTNAGSRAASTAKGSGRDGAQAGAGKPSPTKHARVNTRQHAAATPFGASLFPRKA